VVMVRANGVTRPEDKTQRQRFSAGFARQHSDATLKAVIAFRLKFLRTLVGDAEDFPARFLSANGHPNAPESASGRHRTRIPFVADLRLNAPNFP
jgi:hypothetical protein